MRPYVLLSICLTLAAACLALLLSGASMLVYALPGGLPLGNLIAAAFFAAVGSAAWPLTLPGGFSRRIAALAMCVSWAWLPLSVALAGNLSLSFEGERGTLWLAYSAIALVCALMALLAAVGARLLALRRAQRETGG